MWRKKGIVQRLSLHWRKKKCRDENNISCDFSRSIAFLTFRRRLFLLLFFLFTHIFYLYGHFDMSRSIMLIPIRSPVSKCTGRWLKMRTCSVWLARRPVVLLPFNYLFKTLIKVRAGNEFDSLFGACDAKDRRNYSRYQSDDVLKKGRPWREWLMEESGKQQPVIIIILL